MSKLAYWQSEALSHDLPAQVGSQSQLNARQLVSCPSLLAAALVTDPTMVLVPLLSPPRQSQVTDWLKQLKSAQPIRDSEHSASNKPADSKSASTATKLLPVDYGQPVDSKLAAVPDKNIELVNGTLTNIDNQKCPALSSEKQDFDGKTKNNNGKNGGGGNSEIEENRRKKSLPQKRECRVSFLTDVEQSSKISSDELTPEEGLKFDEDNIEVDSSYPAAADDDGEFRMLEETKSPISDSSSILFCSLPSSGGHQSLPKASFIELEVPDSWRPHRQSQIAQSPRHSGSVELPPLSTGSSSCPAVRVHVASTPCRQSQIAQSSRHSGSVEPPPLSTGTSSGPEARLHVASTPTTRLTTHLDDEMVDLSAVITCSPITPRRTSDQMVRSRPGERTDSSGVGVEKDHADLPAVISCSPITPRTSLDQTVRSRPGERTHSSSVGAEKDHNGDDEDVVVIPCSPLTPKITANQRPTKDRSHESGPDDDDDDDDDVTVIPCTPVSESSSQPMKTGSQDERGPQGRQDGAVEDEELMIVPCSPATPTTVSNQALWNQPQRLTRGMSRLKVVVNFSQLHCMHAVLLASLYLSVSFYHVAVTNKLIS